MQFLFRFKLFKWPTNVVLNSGFAFRIVLFVRSRVTCSMFVQFGIFLSKTAIRIESRRICAGHVKPQKAQQNRSPASTWPSHGNYQLMMHHRGRGCPFGSRSDRSMTGWSTARLLLPLWLSWELLSKQSLTGTRTALLIRWKPTYNNTEGSTPPPDYVQLQAIQSIDCTALINSIPNTVTVPILSNRYLLKSLNLIPLSVNASRRSHVPSIISVFNFKSILLMDIEWHIGDMSTTIYRWYKHILRNRDYAQHVQTRK